MLTPTLVSGQVLVRIFLRGTPDIVFKLARDKLPAGRILRAGLSRQVRDWLRGETSRGLAWIEPTERKLADMTLAQECQHMSAEQIETAERLHGILFDVLRGRAALPDFPPGSPLDVGLELEGPAPRLADQLLALGPSEIVRDVHVAGVYNEGKPPKRPYDRWLPSFRSHPKGKVLTEFELFARFMPADSADLVRQTAGKVALFFERRQRTRVQVITSLAREKMGDKADAWLAEKTARYATETRLEDMVTDHGYERAVKGLKGAESRQPRRPRRAG